MDEDQMLVQTLQMDSDEDEQTITLIDTGGNSKL